MPWKGVFFVLKDQQCCRINEKSNRALERRLQVSKHLTPDVKKSVYGHQRRDRHIREPPNPLTGKHWDGPGRELPTSWAAPSGCAPQLLHPTRKKPGHPLVALNILPSSHRETNAYFVQSLKAHMWFSWLQVQSYFPWIMLAILVFLQTFSCPRTLLKKFYHPIKAKLISCKRGKPQQPVLENHTYYLPCSPEQPLPRWIHWSHVPFFHHQAVDSSVHYAEQLALRQLCCQHMMNHPLSLNSLRRMKAGHFMLLKLQLSAQQGEKWILRTGTVHFQSWSVTY